MIFLGNSNLIFLPHERMCVRPGRGFGMEKSSRVLICVPLTISAINTHISGEQICIFCFVCDQTCEEWGSKRIQRRISYFQGIDCLSFIFCLKVQSRTDVCQRNNKSIHITFGGWWWSLFRVRHSHSQINPESNAARDLRLYCNTVSPRECLRWIVMQPLDKQRQLK